MPLARLVDMRQGRDYFIRFGTLNIASRFVPKLIVLSRVPLNWRLRPLVATKVQPAPLVIFFPRRTLVAGVFFVAIRLSSWWCEWTSRYLCANRREAAHRLLEPINVRQIDATTTPAGVHRQIWALATGGRQSGGTILRSRPRRRWKSAERRRGASMGTIAVCGLTLGRSAGRAFEGFFAEVRR